MSTNRLKIPTQPPISVTFDTPETASSTVVVCCPPDPTQGGSRSDVRLRRIASVLTARGIATIRFDYRESTEPTTDLRAVLDHIREGSIDGLDHVDQIHLFGYSYGGSVVIEAAATEVDSAKIAVLAPVVIYRSTSILPALTAIDQPLLIILGDQDRIIDSETISSHAPPHAHIHRLNDDHSFSSHIGRIERIVADFFTT